MSKETTGLVMTVGTSLQVELHTLRKLKPDFVVLLTTDTGTDDAINKIRSECREIPDANWEIRRFPDQSESLPQVIEHWHEAHRWLREKGVSRIYADFTGGRKWMSAGLLMGAIRSDAIPVYVNAKYEDGKPKKGTERLDRLDDLRKSLWRSRMQEAVREFNRFAFQTATTLFDDIYKDRAALTLSQEALARTLKLTTEVVAEWDRFAHLAAEGRPGKTATRIRNQMPDLKRACRELGLHAFCEWAEKMEKLADDIKLLDNDPDEKYRITDLYQNAKRRIKTGAYEDAVARLYRCSEALVDHVLRRRGNESANLRGLKEKIVWMIENGAKEYKLFVDDGKTLEENKLRYRFPSDARNQSVLAHGWIAVQKDTAEKYACWAEDTMRELGFELERFELPRMPEEWT